MAMLCGLQQLVCAAQQVGALLGMSRSNARGINSLEPAVAMLAHDLSPQIFDAHL